ncbi:MAG TPA: transglycosylase domain-containing protein [Candidatus Saccharibacteria bacterium]|nr:transglycosylase domain-containing protein [Candidatus Saccharibacteria bacterium]
MGKKFFKSRKVKFNLSKFFKFKPKRLSVYSNLVHSRKIKKDTESRKHAQYLASLPKNPIKRFFYRLHPKRVAKYWFSKRGAIMALKIAGISVLIVCLMAGGLFAYFRKDLDAIRPGELAKRVQTTVTKYYDRNGELLWEDKGEGDYKLVVDSKDINEYLKQATVSIEDKEFYKHGGVSASGLIRAVINNLRGRYTQGGSTLTQQLIKQVFFADESGKRGLSGIPRKIKEIILSIEVERMYNKDQILTLYLNESPYGGRRNGVESAAQTYFSKSAKDLTIAEAALLASIPQDPSYYNPYYIEGHEALLYRQHKVIDNMQSMGYIDKKQAKEAKEYPIIDHIAPEASQYTNIKAPHFVQMVRSELEKELGKSTVGKGGLKVTTTLDIRIQNKLEEAMNDMFSSSIPDWAGFTNGAATVEDTKTGQIIALMGSRDFNLAGYGQDNAATAYIQPGSTVKALVYAKLFEKKTGVNYGSGSILNDVNISSIYGAPLYNADRTFKGPVTIRSALATSRNIPAVTAMYISGVKPTIETIRKLGATSYCTQGDEVNVGLASAIGGCGIKQIDLVNAYASLAREGAYKSQSTILEVKNNSGEVLKKWVDPESTQIVDKQSAYIVSDILSDDNARAPLNGYHARGMEIPGVKTATKTGTSDKGGNAKDIWMVSYSPALTMGVWLGNSDASILRNGTSSLPGSIIAKVIEYAHKDIYANEGKWKSGDWYVRPIGIQIVNNELYPSWWNKSQGQSKTMMTFDKYSKKKATEFTPPSAKIELEIIKMTDPITKKDVFTAPDGYDPNSDDDAHKESDQPPSVTIDVDKKPLTKNTYTITATVNKGTFDLSSTQILIAGVVVNTFAYNGSDEYSFDITLTESDTSQKQVSASVVDVGYYTNDSNTDTLPIYKE